MHTLDLGSIGQSWNDYEARQRAAQESARAAQLAYASASLRQQALEAALRTGLAKNGHESILEAARAYEAYLKGE